MANVFAVLASKTVIDVRVTLEMTGPWTGSGAVFFFVAPNAGFTASNPQAIAMRNKREFFMASFLVERNFRQNGWFDHIFGFFQFIRRVNELSAWIDQMRGHEDDQV